METKAPRGRPRQKYTGKFGAFVTRLGVDNLATELDVDVRSIYGWLRRQCLPSPSRALEIIAIARRNATKLTLEDIYVRGDTRVPLHKTSGTAIASSQNSPQ